ncbi:hypothetical protein K4F52_008068 [Lecanicillium sp. MT-2017a]|nr:hypothetical protein K4F52_008068 [Lecanicillium sp. MT-2017a]
MDEEKDIAHSPKETVAKYEVEAQAHHRRSSIALGEAADLYGNIHDAQELGYVSRGLKSRHIQFIALGGTIGTGLFIGIGSAFTESGPLSVLLGYTFTGFAIFGMMNCLGEMATWLPLPGAIPQYCARYVDPAMGFAVGWNNWYSAALTLCAEISAACLVINFWNESINSAAWITIIIVLVVCLNIFAVSIYGEAEFVFASIKIITIVGLLILALIIDVGGVPTQPRLGFHYWMSPYEPMKQVVASGDAGRFLGFFSTLVNAAFSFGGVEMVAVAAGEAADPRRNIPKAVRRVFWRIIFFYVLGSLAIGVCVASDDPDLLHGSGSAASPWVIAAKRAGIKVLPSIINAVILTSATSSANAFLYSGSRYLFALAQNGQAPRFFLKCNKRGVPVTCILFTASFACLTYMTVSSGSAVVFGWFQTLTTITSLLTWTSVLIAYLNFKKALHAQGIDRRTLPFRSRFQPYAAYVALGFFLMIIIFNGWKVFTKGNWNVQSFITAYVCVPIYLSFFTFWKIFKRTKFVKAEEADIFTGKAAIDAEVWPERKPRNLLERIWFFIA